MRNRARFVLASLALALAGCARQASEHRSVSTMTEAQRDSAIARSDIPGAHAVARAFQFAEKSSRATVNPDSLEH